MSSEVNDRVIKCEPAQVNLAENVEVASSRKILRIKKTAHVNAKISTAAGYQYLH